MPLMHRRSLCVLTLVIAAGLSSPARAADAGQSGDGSPPAKETGNVSPPAKAANPSPPKSRLHAKRRPVQRWHGYGFLPGYVPPEVAERQRDWEYWNRHPTYWYGGPGFYRGRWNGGGFGPCYTQTPIGPIWNCGR